MDQEQQMREYMEQVRQDVYFEEQEEANRQKEIVSYICNIWFKLFT